jgi:hypothetical protein
MSLSCISDCFLFLNNDYSFDSKKTGKERMSKSKVRNVHMEESNHDVKNVAVVVFANTEK